MKKSKEKTVQALRALLERQDIFDQEEKNHLSSEETAHLKIYEGEFDIDHSATSATVDILEKNRPAGNRIMNSSNCNSLPPNNNNHNRRMMEFKINLIKIESPLSQDSNHRKNNFDQESIRILPRQLKSSHSIHVRRRNKVNLAPAENSW